MEEEGSSEDDERLENTVPGDPVEGACKVLSTNKDGGALIEPTCHGFDKPPTRIHRGTFSHTVVYGEGRALQAASQAQERNMLVTTCSAR